MVNKRAVDHLRIDPVMAGGIERIGLLRHKPHRLPPFESLVHAVVHQQLSGTAAGAIFRRFLALFGTDEFPSPRYVLQLPLETLRALPDFPEPRQPHPRFGIEG